MTLFRFTFNRGSYDIGQAVVLADSFPIARAKLAAACTNKQIAESQNVSPHYPWRMEDVVWEDAEPKTIWSEAPLKVEGDVVFTWGVDG